MSNKNDKKSEFTSFGTRISDEIVQFRYSPSLQKKVEKAHKMIKDAGFPELPEKKNSK